MYSKRQSRKTLKETVIENQAYLSAMARLMGKPEYKPVITFEAKKPRAAPKKSNNPTEAEVLKSCLSFLRMHPQVGWVCRQNSGTFMDGDRYISANSQKGMSDILGMLKGGQLFAIEVKSLTGKVMLHQQEFLDLIAKNGGLSGVARSIEDCERILFKNQ